MNDRSVLLVETSDTQALLLATLLEHAGLHVHREATAEAAVHYLQSVRPGIAIVDRHLPGMQGNEFCRLIRNNPSTASIPLLILTDGGEAAAESAALEGVADASLDKTDTDMLLARVDLLLRRAEPAKAERAAFYRAHQILVVDDSPTYLALLEGELTADGYRVFTAINGDEAVKVASQNALDCAVVDLIMPGMDGIELCRRLIKLRGPGNLLPVLIVTARGSKERMMEALEVGADDYVEKANDATILKARLRALLRRKAQQDEQQRIRDEIRDKEMEVVRTKAAAEERTHLLLDSIGEGVLGVDQGMSVTFANRAARTMLGLPESEIIGASLDRLFRPAATAAADGPPSESSLMPTLRDGEALQGLEGTLGRADGTRFPVALSSRPVMKDDALVGAVVSFEDISRRLEMETRLVQSQKMEAVGRLTGGVAHDFNNLLTVIIGNLQLLQRTSEIEAHAATRIDKIMNAARSGAELTRRLLSFSRQQVLETASVDINEVARDTAEIVQRTIADTISVTAVVPATPSYGITDRTQLSHALLNLCFNARDAMPNGGRLTIETRQTALDDGYAATHADVKPGDYIEIAVTDSGTGIPPDILDKIFEPFFTTKEKGQGTGLGLSTIFGFMKQSGGHVSVYSEVGRGSTFRLFVPVASGAAEIAAPDRPVPRVGRPGPGATILVVEDDAGVRDSAVWMLQQSGFKVVEAENGLAGLKAIEAHPEIALVFSDVTLPGGLSGPEMADRIRKRRPELPVLFASGYAEQALRNRDAAVKDVQFIAKPYDAGDLAERIERLLEGAAA